VTAHGHAERGRPRAVSGQLEVAARRGDTEAVPGRDDDRGRPDLDVQPDRLAGSQRPALVVGVPGPAGQAPVGIGLAVRGPQPPEADAPVRVLAAGERDVVPAGIGDPQGQETVDPEKWVPDGYVVIRVDSSARSAMPSSMVTGTSHSIRTVKSSHGGHACELFADGRANCRLPDPVSRLIGDYGAVH
jgi:hypothetical protein